MRWLESIAAVPIALLVGCSSSSALPEGNSEEPLQDGGTSADPIDRAIASLVTGDCLRSVDVDFAERDLLPQTDTPVSEWPTGDTSATRMIWGPKARPMPSVDVPVGCPPSSWRRARILSVARHYLGLPHRNHHIPAWKPVEGPGLDCSNYTAWVYNYGLGMKFTGNVSEQADITNAPGRRLLPGEGLLPGDLLYLTRADGSEIVHVSIYVDATHVIDSTGPGVRIRDAAGWYVKRFSHTRRVLE